MKLNLYYNTIRIRYKICCFPRKPSQLFTMKNILIILIFIASFSGCNPQLFDVVVAEPETLKIEVLKPAKINIPKNVKKLLVIDQSNYLEEPIDHVDLGGTKRIHSRAISGMLDALSTTERFEVLVLSNSAEYKALDYTKKNVEWSSIDSICKKFKSDAVIILENARLEGNYRPVPLKYSYGTHIPGEHYFHFTLKTLWLMFDSKNHEALKRPVELIGKNYIAENRQDDIRNNAFKCGEQFAAIISPVWKSYERYFYRIKNIDLLNKAADLALDNKWKEAEAIWIKFINDEREKVARYASFNLALAYEMQGKLEEALKYATYAHEELGFKESKYYQEVLEKRIADQPIIQKQLN